LEAASPAQLAELAPAMTALTEVFRWSPKGTPYLEEMQASIRDGVQAFVEGRWQEARLRDVDPSMRGLVEAFNSSQHLWLPRKVHRPAPGTTGHLRGLSNYVLELRDHAQMNGLEWTTDSLALLDSAIEEAQELLRGEDNAARKALLSHLSALGNRVGESELRGDPRVRNDLLKRLLPRWRQAQGILRLGLRMDALAQGDQDLGLREMLGDPAILLALRNGEPLVKRIMTEEQLMAWRAMWRVADWTAKDAANSLGLHAWSTNSIVGMVGSNHGRCMDSRGGTGLYALAAQATDPFVVHGLLGRAGAEASLPMNTGRLRVWLGQLRQGDQRHPAIFLDHLIRDSEEMNPAAFALATRIAQYCAAKSGQKVGVVVGTGLGLTSDGADDDYLAAARSTGDVEQLQSGRDSFGMYSDWAFSPRLLGGHGSDFQAMHHLAARRDRHGPVPVPLENAWVFWPSEEAAPVGGQP
jgi:hypothetical protein